MKVFTAITTGASLFCQQNGLTEGRLDVFNKDSRLTVTAIAHDYIHYLFNLNLKNNDEQHNERIEEIVEEIQAAITSSATYNQYTDYMSESFDNIIDASILSNIEFDVLNYVFNLENGSVKRPFLKNNIVEDVKVEVKRDLSQSPKLLSRPTRPL